MLMSSDRHAIVGEIGSHHLRFAIADIDELTIDHLVNFKAGDFSSVQQALFAYLKSLAKYPKIASLAIAGSIEKDRAHIANLSRTFTGKELEAALDLDSVTLIADIDAIARATELLGRHDVRKIAGTSALADKPRAVISLGEKLEAAIAVPGGGKWSVLPSRAGGMFLGAADEEDLWLLEQVRQEVGGTSAGSILTSAGMVALSGAISRQAGATGRYSTVAAILAAACKEKEPSAVDTLKRFGLWLGRFSNDFVLATGAEGGLYLAGEMPTRLLEVLSKDTFEAASGNAAYSSTTPVYVITALNTALRGAAMAIA